MKRNLFISSILAILLTGCFEIKPQKAKVVDSEVEGLEYQCTGLIDYTDKNGTLECSHMPIAFLVGEIKLGIIYKIPKDGIILPQDIVNVPRDKVYNKDVIKILTILQSLDSDKNPENGIQITKETRDKLSKLPVIDIKKYSLDEIKELIETQIEDINFTKPKESILHLNRSMRRYNITKQKLDETILNELEID